MNDADQKRKKNEISKYVIDPDVLKEISRGVNGHKSDEGKKSYFHNKLISKFGNDYKNLVDFRGDTLLHVAASLGHFDLCKFILDLGCDINKRGENGVTPLQDLVYAYQTHIAGKLLGEKNDPNAEYLKLFELFVKKGADLNLEDDYGYSVVELIVLHENIDMMNKAFASGVKFVFNAQKGSDVSVSGSDQKVKQSSSEASSSDQKVKQSSSEASSSDQKVKQSSSEASSSDQKVKQSSTEESNISLDGMIDIEANNTKKFRLPSLQNIAQFFANANKDSKFLVDKDFFSCIEILIKLLSEQALKEKKNSPDVDIFRVFSEALRKEKQNSPHTDVMRFLSEHSLKDRKNSPNPDMFRVFSEALKQDKQSSAHEDIFRVFSEAFRKEKQNSPHTDVMRFLSEHSLKDKQNFFDLDTLRLLTQDIRRDKENSPREEFVNPEILAVSLECASNFQNSYHSKK